MRNSVTQPDDLRTPDLSKDAFVNRLRKLHRDCMRPSYRMLTKISAELTQLYPNYRGKLPPLSPAAISEVLAGKRKGVPSPEWVASFVLSCQQWACRVNAIRDDPGPASLPEWYAALRTACQTLAATQAKHEHISQQKQQTYRCPPSTVRLTPAQREAIEGYGPYGRALAERLPAGDPEAVYRVALLLGAVPAHVNAAHALLLQAAAAYHSAALELLDSSDAGPSPLDAARHAYRLADAAQAGGAHEEAQMYYECAAASLRLAIDWLGQHDKRQIADWLATIADRLGSRNG